MNNRGHSLNPKFIDRRLGEGDRRFAERVGGGSDLAHGQSATLLPVGGPIDDALMQLTPPPENNANQKFQTYPRLCSARRCLHDGAEENLETRCGCRLPQT